MTQDIIIIGAGLGGLVCGAALSSVGKKVLVLEKHHSIGGYLQGFTRGQWHWNIGTHYIGDADSSGTFPRLMNALLGGRVVFHRLDEHYECIVTDGYRHDVVANRDDVYLRLLQREFPSEEKHLAAFFKLLKKMRRRLGLLLAPKLFTGPWKHLAHAVTRAVFLKYWNKTVQDILDRYFADAKLKMLLAVHCDKTIMRPDEASFLSWLMIQNSYQDGACYPEGGGEAITNALKETIVAGGGAVHTGKGVRRIRLNGKRIAGVMLENGDVLDCNKVVSDIGILETAERLMPEGRTSPGQRIVVERYKPSGAFMTLHVGFEGDITPFGIRNANYRIMGEAPYDFTKNPLSEEWQPANLLISFPSMRDQSHSDTLHHTAEILVPVLFSHFDRWAETKVNQRGEDYSKHKERITGKLLALLDRTFPGIGSFVAFTNLSTPLSYNYYTGHKKGAAYGLASRVGRSTDLNLHPASDIKGLYYTGADSLSHGITGAFMSGIFTAVALSGKFSIFTLKHAIPNESGSL